MRMQNTNNPLQGRIVAVTGASSGIGKAIAVRAAASGARVACCGRDREKLETAKALLAGDGHEVYLFDSGDLPGIEACAAEIARGMGPLSGLVHSAGASAVQLLRDANYEKTEELLRINYLAFLAFAKGACRKGRYAAQGMSVAAISSLAAISPDPGLTAYAASKAALNAAVSALAREYAPRGIRFNSICPSYVNTPMNDALKAAIGEEAFDGRVAKNMPLGMIEPEDVADAAIFLLSDASRKITGVHLVIDSGGGAFR